VTLHDDVLRLINDMQAGAESLDLNEPSSVLITDPETGTKTIAGPYSDGYAAFRGMEVLRVKGGLPDECVFEIVPTYPPRGEWA
jgi:hypothetical protein